MPITIVAIGKKHDPELKNVIERYQKRLKKPFEVKWDILPHSSFTHDRARQEESDRISARLSRDEVVILLDERGALLDSPMLSKTVTQYLDQSRKLTFVIGGAYGVTEEFRQRATHIWSLSPLVFPHQLVRVMLIEQLYRSLAISQDRSYHHE